MTISRRSLLAGSALLLSPLSRFAQAKQGLPPGVSDQIHQLMQSNNVPGLGFGLVRHGRVVCVEGFGLADLATNRPVTVDTAFHLASVSKVVTGTVLMQLYEAGRFQLDDPIQPHLDFAVANPGQAAPITFRQLFNHTSSISDGNDRGFDSEGDSKIPLGEFLQGYLSPGGKWYTPSGSYSDVAPGARFDYSNVAIALAGFLAERITGKTLQALSDEQIFGPLKMSPASWSLSALGSATAATPYVETAGKLRPIKPIGYPDWPAGLLRTSSRAMTNFICAYANHGRLGAKRILREDTFRTMITTVSPPPLPQGFIHAQALFWEELGPKQGIMSKDGGDPGAHTLIAFNPASSSGVVLLTNRSPSSGLETDMVHLVQRLLH